jgi:hypothetical protein
MANLRIADLIDHIPRTTLSGDDATIAQHPKVPGNGRLRVASDPNNVTDPLMSIPQDVHDFDPHCVSHALTELGLDLKDGTLRHMPPPNPSRLPIGGQ